MQYTLPFLSHSCQNKDVTESMLEPRRVRLDLLPAPDSADIEAGPEYRLLDGFDFPVMISGDVWMRIRILTREPLLVID